MQTFTRVYRRINSIWMTWTLFIKIIAILEQGRECVIYSHLHSWIISFTCWRQEGLHPNLLRCLWLLYQESGSFLSFTQNACPKFQITHLPWFLLRHHESLGTIWKCWGDRKQIPLFPWPSSTSSLALGWAESGLGGCSIQKCPRGVLAALAGDLCWPPLEGAMVRDLVRRGRDVLREAARALVYLRD